MSESDPRQAHVRPSLKDIFNHALALPAADRSAYLGRVCGDNPDLHARVERMLRVYHEADDFLAAPTDGGPASDAQPAADPSRGSAGSSQTAESTAIRADAERPGASIGRYRLLQQIGEGGFGVVFMAEQREPVVRKVALKVIKLGMDTRQVIARFEAERQALALMDHPNIARVLDAGATAAGRPYFVMELVSGEPITAYCDRGRLTVRQRLELFVQVCHAVQHAHQKGVIHRDLKPGNVLVHTQDGCPHAKVIDFGVAKATAARLTEKTLFTEHRQFLGTPQYMSPEQAEGSLDVDTRTDVYSLGVLLYELLAGVTPFDPASLRGAAFQEMVRIIREVDPPRPSTRVSTATHTLAGVAARRGIDPRKLESLIRGELDWIAMRAMDKDRARRYESPGDLAADILHYLAGEPVKAAPPGYAYRLRKFVRRRRGSVAVVAAVAFGLLVAVGSLAVALRSVTLERDEKQSALLREREARQLAEDHARRAVREGERAARQARMKHEAARFLAEVLESVGPSVARGRDTTLLDEVLESTARRIGPETADDPELEAFLRVTIGNVYQQLSRHDDAEAMFRRAVELRRDQDDPAALAVALNNLGHLLYLRGRFAEAEPLLREALPLHERGPDAASPAYAQSLDNLAKVLASLGRPDEAEQQMRRSIDIRRRLYPGDHVDLAVGLSGLAAVRFQRGDPAEAESLFRESLDMQRRLTPGDAPEIARALSNLGVVLGKAGKQPAAEALHREALEMRRRLFPGDSIDVAISMINLATELGRRNADDDAESHYRAAIEMFERLNESEHPYAAGARRSLERIEQRRVPREDSPP
ncbi:MAG: tetratricopeptide repeat protein [Phycisphaerae bacterium]